MKTEHVSLDFGFDARPVNAVWADCARDMRLYCRKKNLKIVGTPDMPPDTQPSVFKGVIDGVRIIVGFVPAWIGHWQWHVRADVLVSK